MFFTLSGRKGRPRIDMSKEQLQFFIQKGYTVPRMAKHFSCSDHVVKRRLEGHGLRIRNKFSPISDDQLDSTIKELNHKFPNAGSKVDTFPFVIMVLTSQILMIVTKQILIMGSFRVLLCVLVGTQGVLCINQHEMYGTLM